MLLVVELDAADARGADVAVLRERPAGVVAAETIVGAGGHGRLEGAEIIRDLLEEDADGELPMPVKYFATVTSKLSEV